MGRVKIQRQVRYNLFIDTGEQVLSRYRWIVAIINEPREIKRIEQRCYEQLANVNDVNVNYDSLIKESGLHCKIISFSSEKGKIMWPEKIYASSNFKRDRDLTERSEAGLEDYVTRLCK